MTWDPSLLQHLTPAERAGLDALLASGPSAPDPLQWLTVAELDGLERRILASDVEGAREMLTRAERRIAAGESPGARDDAESELERRAYWDELLPAALERQRTGGGWVDYTHLHHEARRLAAERAGNGRR